MAKRKTARGRPPSDVPAVPRSIRIPDDEWSAWRQLAKRECVSVSALIRRTMRSAVARAPRER